MVMPVVPETVIGLVVRAEVRVLLAVVLVPLVLLVKVTVFLGHP
jgi:hypothetical protein